MKENRVLQLDSGLCEDGYAEYLKNGKAVSNIAGIYSYETVISGKGLFYFAGKRFFDVVFSLLALIVLAPVMGIVAVAIKMDSKGPVIFKQKRVGKDGKEFMFYKFRSMELDAESRLEELKELNEMDAVAFKIKNDPRITRVGKVIRKTSIDELPQLVNILKGEMSFIGPRPPLPGEVAQYSWYQRQRLMVKGGLSCYWQIGGRSNVGFDEWVELDLKYMREMSFWVDLKIAVKTIGTVVRMTGAA